MNNIDIILALLLGIGVVQGFIKGFIWEVASLLAVFIALFGALHFSSLASEFLHNSLSFSAKTNQIISFLIVFLVIFVLVRITGKLLTKFLESMYLGPINRIAGALFGLFKWSLIVGTALLYLNKGAIEIIPKEVTDNSLFYPSIIEINTWIRTYIFQFKDTFTPQNFI